jgi:membrane protein YdbS with pleckstrin-like domain
VLVQTAAATQNILFSHIPDPDYVRYAIFTPMRRARMHEQEAMRGSIRQELGRILQIPLPSAGEERQQEDHPAPVAQPPGEEEPLAATPESSSPVDWVAGARRWLGRQITFDSWIVSEGGKTITWRKTIWVLLQASLVPIFAALVDVLLLVWGLARGVGLPLVPLLLFGAFWIIFGWWFYVYWDWQNDIYQVSGNRLIDLKRRPLFLEELRRETTLDRVENVGLTIPSPIAKILNYGTVTIETAGEVGAFTFINVHHPRGVQREIFKRRDRILQEQQAQEKHRRQEELAEWFEIYEDLKKRPDTA